jgi:hypothetical protein
MHDVNQQIIDELRANHGVVGGPFAWHHDLEANPRGTVAVTDDKELSSA